MTQANTTTAGYLSSADWNTFNNKEGALAAGTTAQYYRGDKSWQTLNSTAVPEGTNLYYTDTRARAAISGTAPVSYSSATGAVSMASATSVSDGYLTSGDWTIFNNKATGTLTSGNIFVGNGTNAATGVAMSGDATITNAGVVTVGKLQNRTVASTAPTNGQGLIWNKGLTQWEPGTPAGTDATKLPLAGGTMTGAILMPTGSAAAPSLSFSGDTNTGIYSGVAATLKLATAGSDRMTIDPSGNVGIGTASPFTKFHVAKDSQVYNSGISYGMLVGNATTFNQSLGFGYDTTLDAGFIQSQYLGVGSRPLLLNAIGGNVGVGTTAPVGKLDVRSNGVNAIVSGGAGIGNYGAVIAASSRGSVTAPSATQSGDILGLIGTLGYGATGFPATSRATMYSRAAETWTDSAQGTNLFFETTPTGSTTPTDRMTILAGGNVGIGTTSPTFPLDVRQSSGSSNTIYAGYTGTGTSGATIYGNNSGTGDGVKGYANQGGSGIYGESLQGYGGYFQSNGNGSTGVYAVTFSSTGGNGVYAKSSGTGAAIQAMADGAGTSNYGIFSQSGTAASGFFQSWNATNTAPTLVTKQIGASTADLLQTQNSSGTALVKITSAGNVGVGTTAPATKFHVKGTAYSEIAIFERSDDPGNVVVNGARILSTKLTNMGDGFGSAIAFEIQDDAGVKNEIGGIGATRDGADNSGALIFRTKTAGVENERMRISTAGNLGIGTASPGAKLDVAGTVKIVDGTQGAGKVLTSDAAGLASWTTPSGSSKWTDSGTATYLTQTTDDLGIGTTTPSANLHIADASGSRLVLEHTGGTRRSTVEFRGSGGSDLWFMGNDYAYAGVQDFFIEDRIGAAVRFFINSSGNVGIGVTNPGTKLQVAGVISPSADNTYTLGDATHRFSDVYSMNAANNTSDIREKKEIQESDLGLDFITKLRPVSYLWKSGVDETQHYGLIAQETEKAVADAKNQATDSQKPVIVTYDKNSDRYGIRYTELIAPVIKAIQELYAKFMGHDRDIASVNAKTDKLEAENARLKVNDAAKDKEIAELKARLEKIEKALNSK